MSLYINANFVEKFIKINHGDTKVEQSNFIDVSEVENIRVQTVLEGKDAGSLGTLTVHLFGKIRKNLETIEIGNFIVEASGINEVITSNLFDIRGYEEVCLKFSYASAPTDFVTIKECIGSSQSK